MMHEHEWIPNKLLSHGDKERKRFGASKSWVDTEWR
jgi:hypothetical protein